MVIRIVKKQKKIVKVTFKNKFVAKKRLIKGVSKKNKSKTKRAKIVKKKVKENF